MDRPALTIPRDLRNEARRAHPGLDLHPAYWRFYSYLIAPTHIDDRHAEPVISAATLAGIEGKQHQLAARNYRATRFLAAFQRDALPDLRIVDSWSYREGRARFVQADGVDPEVKAATRAALEVPPWERPNPVRLDTGKQQHERDAPAQRRTRVQLATSIDPATRGCGPIVVYQNAMDRRAYAHITRKNFAAAAGTIEAGSPGSSTDQARHGLSLILEDPVPLLKAVPRSDRAFGIGPTPMTLRSDVRRALTGGWHEYDLRHAQLSIIARLWGVDALAPILAAETNVWEHFADELGVPLETHKAALKRATYTIVFGGGLRRIANDFTHNLRRSGNADDAADVLNHFLRLPLVRSLLVARRIRMDQILRAGGLINYFGREIPARTAAQARSALAQEAQAIEIALILPIYELADQKRVFRVMIYSFDGVTISFRDQRTANAWESRIQAVVENKAAELGVSTRLDRTL